MLTIIKKIFRSLYNRFVYRYNSAVNYLKTFNEDYLKSIQIIRRIKKYKPKVKIFTHKKLVSHVVKNKRNNTCHIIASGYSAYHSYKEGVINENDYIIGFNFSAFLPYHYDIYFIEQNYHLINDKNFNKDVVNKLTTVINKRSDKINAIFLKNIYNTPPDLLATTMFDVIKKNINVVLDVQVYIKIINRLFSAPSIFMPQFSTTTITTTMLAFHAGFKNIVVHGLDFEGPHIYHSEELQNEINVKEVTPYPKPNQQHITAVSQRLIWKDIIREFHKNEVNIFSASDKSNFKDYAPVYRK